MGTVGKSLTSSSDDSSHKGAIDSEEQLAMGKAKTTLGRRKTHRRSFDALTDLANLPGVKNPASMRMIVQHGRNAATTSEYHDMQVTKFNRRMTRITTNIIGKEHEIARESDKYEEDKLCADVHDKSYALGGTVGKTRTSGGSGGGSTTED